MQLGAKGREEFQLNKRLAVAEKEFAQPRAKRARLKSRWDDTRVAPGKRSAARGFGRKMISSLFSYSVSARLELAEKKQCNGVGS